MRWIVPREQQIANSNEQIASSFNQEKLEIQETKPKVVLGLNMLEILKQKPKRIEPIAIC
jgi:hypothetical protein